MNKLLKKGVILAFGLFIWAFNLSFASAVYFPSIRNLSQSIVDSYVDIFEPILQALFGGVGWSGLLLFERLLLAIIIISLAYLALGKIGIFEKTKSIRWIIAICVALLGVRFVNYEQLNAIIIQYQAIFIVLTSILPLLLFFFFIHNISGEYPAVRKILWIFYILVYIGLWSTAQADLNSTVYFWVVVVAILFLVFDNLIHRYFLLQKMKQARSYRKGDIIATLEDDIRRLQRSSLPNKEKLIKKKHEEIEWWIKQM